MQKYHAGSQVQSSTERTEQMHPVQNQECFQGIRPDQELYDPAVNIIRNHQTN